MVAIKELIKTADWKSEKHVPVIDGPEKIKKGDSVTVLVSVGKEIAHPNTTEHHIRWIELYFMTEGEKFPCQLGRFEFDAHGESVQGPNTSTIYAQPSISSVFKTDKSGFILAVSYSKIHGLWENSKQLIVE